MLDGDLARLLQVQDALFQAIHRLDRVLVGLGGHHVLTAVPRGLGGLGLQLDQLAGLELGGERLAGGDIGVEFADRAAGLLVQPVQHGHVPAHQVDALFEFHGDGVDLRGDGLELCAEPLELGPQPAKEAAEEAGLFQVRRIESLGLGDDVGEQISGVAHLPVLGLTEDPVGEPGHVALGALAKGGDLGCVADLYLFLDRDDLV